MATLRTVTKLLDRRRSMHVRCLLVLVPTVVALIVLWNWQSTDPLNRAALPYYVRKMGQWASSGSSFIERLIAGHENEQYRTTELLHEENYLLAILESRMKNIPCFEPSCPGTFSAIPRERLHQVLKTRSKMPQNYRQALLSAIKNVTSHKYIFVTAVSSSYYYNMQAQLANIFQNLLPVLKGKDYVFIIFDLGLSADERLQTEKYCRCTVLDFPFSQLPVFVKQLRCYTWKPLIISTLIEKAEYLIWMDASIRWDKNAQLDTILERTRERGFQARPNYGSIAVRTNKSMTDFYNDHLCQYAHFDEFDNNLGFYYNDRFTRDAILAPWVSCALNETCMCLPDHFDMLMCGQEPPRRYGRCHRFDQASISIIFTKLLLDYRPMVHMPEGSTQVKRADGASWFGH